MLNLRRLDSNAWTNGGDNATYMDGKYDCISTKVLGDLAAPLEFRNPECSVNELQVDSGPLAAGLAQVSRMKGCCLGVI